MPVRVPVRCRRGDQRPRSRVAVAAPVLATGRGRRLQDPSGHHPDGLRLTGRRRSTGRHRRPGGSRPNTPARPGTPAPTDPGVTDTRPTPGPQPDSPRGAGHHRRGRGGRAGDRDGAADRQPDHRDRRLPNCPHATADLRRAAGLGDRGPRTSRTRRWASGSTASRTPRPTTATATPTCAASCPAGSRRGAERPRPPRRRSPASSPGPTTRRGPGWCPRSSSARRARWTSAAWRARSSRPRPAPPPTTGVSPRAGRCSCSRCRPRTGPPGSPCSSSTATSPAGRTNHRHPSVRRWMRSSPAPGSPAPI